MSMMIELVKCEACRMTWLSPFKICPRCKPRERYEEEEIMRSSARPARGIAMDRCTMSLLAVLEDGSFVNIRDAYHIVRDGVYESRDDLIRDLTATKKELTEVLAENA